MLKHTLAMALSAAVLATATTVILVLPVERAAAEMAKAKDKSGMSGKERRAKCSAEWKDAKAAAKTSGLKWPKFYSDCNKRLKGSA